MNNDIPREVTALTTVQNQSSIDFVKVHQSEPGSNPVTDSVSPHKGEAKQAGVITDSSGKVTAIDFAQISPYEVMETDDAKTAAEKAMKALTDDGRSATTDGAPRMTEQERFDAHKKVVDYIDVLTAPIGQNRQAASVAAQHGRFDEAEKLMTEAVKMSDGLPIDFIKQEVQLVANDAEKVYRGELKDGLYQSLVFANAAMSLPINTRRDLINLHLGTQVVLKQGTSGELSLDKITYGQTSHFDPNKAFDFANQVREKSKAIYGIDPASVSDRALTDVAPDLIRPMNADSNYFYAIENATGKKFDIQGLLRPEQFADAAVKVFDKIDKNKDGYATKQELDAALEARVFKGDAKTMQVLPIWISENESISKYSSDAWFNEKFGTTKADLVAFGKDVVASQSHVKAIVAARDIMLNNGNFEFADTNSDDFVSREEMEVFLADDKTLSKEQKITLQQYNERLQVKYPGWAVDRETLAFPSEPEYERLHHGLWTTYLQEKSGLLHWQ